MYRRIMTVGLVAVGLLVCGPARGYALKREEVAVVKTPFGEIVWRFFTQHAPGHVAYVRQLITQGFYDGMTFHRVIPHFVIQGGDPNSKNADRSDDGNGEADRRLKAEFSEVLHYKPGTVGMARDVDPDSGSCQFFITLENIPRLDAKYTIFGEVISGLEIARKIAEQPRDLNDNPLQRVPVTVRLEKRGVPEKIYSLEPGESGELLTGPARPRSFDPGNILFKPPKWHQQASPATPAAPLPPGRLELVVDTAGKVLDVRFVREDQAEADRLRMAALSWSFEPAEYDGKPLKTRFQIDSDGSHLGPPTGGGAPVELGEGIVPPRIMISVEVPPEKKVPERPTLLRLTIDASGGVVDVAMQSSCGDSDLDAAAAQAAFALLFEPATRGAGEEAEPVAVYLNVQTRFNPRKSP